MTTPPAVAQQPGAGRVPFLHNVSWMAVGNISYVLQQAAFIFLVARFAGAAGVGVYALATAIVEPPFRLFSFNLRVAQATDLKDEYPFADYIALRFLTTLLAAVLVAGWAVGNGSSKTIPVALFLVAMLRGLESMVEMWHAAMQRHGTLRQQGISLTVNGLAGLALSSLTLVLYPVMEAALVVRVGLFAVILLAYDIPSTMRVTGWDLPTLLPSIRGLHWDRMRRLAVRTLPLGWVMFFAALNMSVPQIALNRWSDLRDGGIYGGFAQILAAGQVLTSSLGATLLPLLARHHQAAAYRSYRRALILAVAGATLVPWLALPALALGGDHLIGWVMGEDYMAQVSILYIMVVGAGFFYGGALLALSLNAMRKFSDQAFILPLVCAVNYGCCWWWVPESGARGAAFAFLVSSVLLFVLRLHRVVQRLRDRREEWDRP